MADTSAKKEESSQEKPAQPPPEVASDPEEDDLSDLDDVLDEFANTKLGSKSPLPSTTTTSGPGRPLADPADLLSAGEDEEFAKQLEAQMEQLLGNKDFGKQFEDIMAEMAKEAPDELAAAERGDGAPAPESAASAGKNEANFQETIRKTMERMQESGDKAGEAAADAGSDDILAQMLKEMESGGFGGLAGAGGEGGEGDEDFSKMLMGMMEQLTNREILYEPMKELNDKFPAWMEANREKVAKEDLKRYEEQQSLVKEIVGRFERQGYSDSNSSDREYIVERMQKMQAAGSPPPDLVGDMNAAQEALSEIDQGCPTQ